MCGSSEVNATVTYFVSEIKERYLDAISAYASKAFLLIILRPM